MDRFLILGAGVTGMTAAAELSALGGEVTVVEQTSFIGGHVTASSYCCKATSACARCGVCVAHTQLDTSLRDPRIGLYTASAVETCTSVKGGISARVNQQQPAIDYSRCTSCDACISACPERCIITYRRAEITQYIIDYEKCRKRRGEPCTACADACPTAAVSCDEYDRTHTINASSLLVATGHTPYDATKKPRYGYGKNSKIMTGLEAESALADAENFGDPEERVAFVQCVGSRDPSIGRNFCSGVCCAYAVRIARMLKYRNPEMQVDIYYIDLQNFDREFTTMLKEVEELGVSLVRGLPFRIDEEADGSLAFLLESSNGERVVARYDRAILSVGIDSREDAMHVVDVMGLLTNEYGFMTSNGGADGHGGRPNVYTCGTCNRPMSMPESMAAARDTARKMWAERSR